MIPKGGGAAVEFFNILRVGAVDVRRNRIANEMLKPVLALRVCYIDWRHWRQ